MKRTGLVLVIFTCSFLSCLFSGETKAKEGEYLPYLVYLMQESGVQIDGIELEGWVSFRQGEDPQEMFRKMMPLQDMLKSTEVVFLSCQPGQGQNQDLATLLVKVKHRGSLERAFLWESGLRELLETAGREHGLSLTVSGRIPGELEAEQQLAWAQSLFGQAGGKVSTSLKTAKYLSLTGFTPFLPDFIWDGKNRVNLNVAVVCSPGSGETLVYLGYPLISCEY
jgi:hypothetical protein